MISSWLRCLRSTRAVLIRSAASKHFCISTSSLVCQAGEGLCRLYLCCILVPTLLVVTTTGVHGCGSGIRSGGVTVTVCCGDCIVTVFFVKLLLSVCFGFLFRGESVVCGLEGGMNPDHSIAPTLNIFIIWSRTIWHILVVIIPSFGLRLMTRLGESVHRTLVIRWTRRHLVTSLWNAGIPTPPHKYDLMVIASMVSTSSSSSMNNCVFAVVLLPDGFNFLFDFGKRKKYLRVPQSHVPTPGHQIKYYSHTQWQTSNVKLWILILLDVSRHHHYAPTQQQEYFVSVFAYETFDN